MPESASCPFCSDPLEDNYLYVRGVAAALFRSTRPDVGLLSRSGLTQIDLAKISPKGTGAQAVIKSLYCDNCGALCFKSS